MVQHYIIHIKTRIAIKGLVVPLISFLEMTSKIVIYHSKNELAVAVVLMKM